MFGEKYKAEITSRAQAGSLCQIWNQHPQKASSQPHDLAVSHSLGRDKEPGHPQKEVSPVSHPLSSIPCSIAQVGHLNIMLPFGTHLRSNQSTKVLAGHSSQSGAH